MVTKHLREKCPGLLHKLQLVFVCGGQTGHSVCAFTAVRALTNESVRHTQQLLCYLLFSFLLMPTELQLSSAVDGGSTAGVPCKAYRAASWMSPKS